MLGVNMRFIVSGVFSLDKCGKTWKNWLCFLAAMARFAKYCMDSYNPFIFTSFFTESIYMGII